MDFFLNEILENNAVAAELEKHGEMRSRARRIAEYIIDCGEYPSLEDGLLPVFVLGFLAAHALEKNSRRGIPPRVTIATLKDINLWLDNYHSSNGRVGLGEFGWLIHHYTGRLFRLGRLQFRLIPAPAQLTGRDFVLETHIPQGEILEVKECLRSFTSAITFYNRYFQDYRPDCFICTSWLLNKNLSLLLSPESNIVRFMELWTPLPCPSDDSGQAIERVFGFGFRKENLRQAPENTRLQQQLKAFLLEGGSLDITAGCRAMDS